MFNLTTKTINLIKTFLDINYKLLMLVIALIILYLLLPDPIVNTLAFFNYLPQFLLNLHKSPETLSSLTEIQEIKETLSLMSNLFIYQDATILELSNQIKDANQTVSNLKQDIVKLNNEYKLALDSLTILINEIPNKITAIMPEVVLPEINTKRIETLLSSNLEKTNKAVATVLTKVNEFSQLQKIQLDQGKLSYKLLCQEFDTQASSLNELKHTLISGNQLLIDTYSAKTKELLLNLSTTNLSNSIVTNNDLLNKLITSQKDLLNTSDFTKGLDTIKEGVSSLNINLMENDTKIKDISSTLTGLDYNFHTKVNSLDNKIDNISNTVNDINSTKVVKTDVQGTNSWTNWYNNKK